VAFSLLLLVVVSHGAFTVSSLHTFFNFWWWRLFLSRLDVELAALKE